MGKEPRRRSSYLKRESNKNESNIWNDTDDEKEDNYESESSEESPAVKKHFKKKKSNKRKEKIFHKKTSAPKNKLSDPQISNLERCIAFAQSEFQDLELKLERVKKMYNELPKLRECGFFTAAEIEEYKDSYLYHWDQIKGRVEQASIALKAAKDMWQEKQEKMNEMYQTGLLDDGVCNKWENSLENYHEIIAQLDGMITPFEE